MSTNTLGIKLRELRLERKLPLRKVAALLEIDVAILSKMETGKRRITKELVQNLAGIYNYRQEELMVLFLSDRILYEIGDDPLAGQALKAAEGISSYKTLNQVSQAEEFKSNLVNKFKSYFASQHLVTQAYLFGSFARGDYQPSSDIDVVIDVPREISFTLFDLADVQENLERIANRKVDVVMLNGLRPAMKSRIEKEMELIFKA